MQIFIEFWKAKDAWRDLSAKARGEYLGVIGPVISDLASKGVVMEAWGENTDNTPQRPDYDFFAVTKFPNDKMLKEFQAIVEGAGWYNYFDQVNVSGDNIGAEAVIGKMIGL